MSKAIIVFANGSKSLAHNTDDLKFRWAERKAAQNEHAIAEQYKQGIYIRDCRDLKDFAKAVEWKAQFKQQLGVVQVELAFLKGTLSDVQYRQRARNLQVASKEIQLQLGYLGDLIREENRLKTEALQRRAVQQRENGVTPQIKEINRINEEKRRLREALVSLYKAVAAAQTQGGIECNEDLQNAMAAASEFMPQDYDH